MEKHSLLTVFYEEKLMVHFLKLVYRGVWNCMGASFFSDSPLHPPPPPSHTNWPLVSTVYSKSILNLTNIKFNLYKTALLYHFELYVSRGWLLVMTSGSHDRQRAHTSKTATSYLAVAKASGEWLPMPSTPPLHYEIHMKIGNASSTLLCTLNTSASPQWLAGWTGKVLAVFGGALRLLTPAVQSCDKQRWCGMS